MDGSQTQQSTQLKEDPRRLGRNNSGLSERDIADVFCILHPASPAAYKIVASTARTSPQHILQNDPVVSSFSSQVPIEEQETFRIQDHQDGTRLSGLDLALRFSTRTREPWTGFVFGRNLGTCDIAITVDAVKRVSNRHFRIYVNDSGIVMLEDMSTNGTMVDDYHLKARSTTLDATRMLHPGAIVQIISAKPEEVIKFIVRLPPKDGHVEAYTHLFQQHMLMCHEALQRKLGEQGKMVNKARPQNLIPLTHSFAVAKTAQKPLFSSTNTHGMHWNGGTQYNVIDVLGKGAFATVYKLATAKDGTVLAAKELEKKRFMRNGRLDQRLDNEMRIMQDLQHDNIVEYKKYHDIGDYLYIIMEYVPYGDLQHMLSKGEVLPEYKAKLMAKQVLKALAYLHKKKITHRDIKPDNILIACEDPFEVKLTDFGLSKVVTNDETFLKTFCGTLLYCAPEVFPHYANAGHGTKRRRGAQSSKTYHAYSPSIDIWSFAAVLWFSLCGDPPFRGITDQTGKGMFDNIMATTLNPVSLRARFVSEEAIDLLMKMLNTDPSARPTEVECLKHPWFGDSIGEADVHDLQAIQEEDESEMLDEDEGIEDDEAQLGAQERFSQLSLRHHTAAGQQSYYENDFESGELEALLDPRASKRVKSDPRFPRHHTRSPPDRETDSYMEGQALEDSPTMGRRSLPQQRLFGEINESALHSSGVFHEKTKQALLLQEESTSVDEVSENEGASYTDSHILHSAHGGSLLANTSALRNLDIAAASPGATSEGTNEPSTPKTPDVPVALSISDGGDISQTADDTPKAPAQPFSRRIDLPRSASSYYDPHDPSTHNLEYASRVSGFDFVQHAEELAHNRTSAKDHAVTPDVTSQESLYTRALPLPASVSRRSIPLPQQSLRSSDEPEIANDSVVYPQLYSSSSSITSSNEILARLPDTMQVTTENPLNLDDVAARDASYASVTSEEDSQFAKPFPRLGRVASTAGSVQKLTINLEQPWTSFGRHPAMSFVYQPVTDVRVPKKAFEIWFYHPLLQSYIEEGKDWSQLEGLHTGITTFAKGGIWINDTLMRAHDKNQRTLYGYIHTGDVITIFKDPQSQSHLSFTVDIFKGQGMSPRPDGQKFMVHKAQKSMMQPEPTSSA